MSDTWEKHGQYDPDTNSWSDERTGEKIDPPKNIHSSFTTKGVVPSISKSAEQSGYRRVASNQPCPIKGCENGTVKFTHNGKSAYWDDGDVYVKP